jgi:hypothetical protein
MLGGAWGERDARAAAPDTTACIEAFDKGQRERTEKKLRAAQTDLLVCTQESCPSVLRADCAGVLRTVQSAMPSIVLAADDGEGHDVGDVTVRIGTTAIADKLDGRALEFDPGTYDFRFERTAKAAGGGPTAVTVHLVLREGEKNRIVRASFPKKIALGDRTLPEPRRSTAGYAVPAGLAVVGVAALGFALYSRLHFDSQVDDLRKSCAPTCTPGQRDDLSSILVTANVSLGIGLGALALSGLSWALFTPRADVRTASGGAWAW